MTFHHQPDQALALVIGLGEELLGRGQNRFRVGLHLDLRHGFHRHGDALLGVQILLRRYVERHQFEREIRQTCTIGSTIVPCPLTTRVPPRPYTIECFVRPRFAIEPGHSIHQKQNDHHAKPDEDPNRQRRWEKPSNITPPVTNAVQRMVRVSELLVAGEVAPINSEWAGCEFKLKFTIEWLPYQQNPNTTYATRSTGHETAWLQSPARSTP